MPEEDLAVVEAVVTANSTMIGSTVEQLALRERYGLNLLALSRPVGIAQCCPRPLSGRRPAQAAGRAERINDKLAALGCLPLAERTCPGAHAQPVSACRGARHRHGLVTWRSSRCRSAFGAAVAMLALCC
jgi:hypothetical protein